MEELERFFKLREDLFAAIKHQLTIDSHCKSYEGLMSIVWPCYFDDEYLIKLDCYIIGPSRHHFWTGKSITEALDRAEADIREWIEESYLEE